jgi:hypothetical protein
MEKALSGIQTSVYSLTVTSWNAISIVFYTDGSLIDGCAGFAIHLTEKSGFGFKITSPASIFTDKLIAFLVTLRHIEEAIQTSNGCLILTNSLSLVQALLSRKISHRTHPLIYK